MQQLLCIANAHKLLEYKLDSSVSTALDQAPSGFILQVVTPRVNVPNGCHVL